MRDSFIFTMITKTSLWRHIYHDSGIPRPKNHDIEIPKPKNHDIEIRRPKTTTSRFQDQKNHDIEIRGLKHQKMKTNKPQHRDYSQGLFSEDKKPRHQDSNIKKPRHRDSKTKKPRHRVPVEF